jgi:hypothetical protein
MFFSWYFPIQIGLFPLTGKPSIIAKINAFVLPFFNILLVRGVFNKKAFFSR